MSEHRAGLVTGLANLLRTGEFSDLEILCGDRHFSVHKNVICCQSVPLKAMCTNGMKESQESVIDLTIDTEPCVSRLVDFFYRCDYDELGDDCEDASTDDEDTAANNDSVAQWNLGSGKDDAGTYSNDASSDDFLPVPLIVTPRQLSLHIDMYVLADKYDVSSLAELAKKKFETMAEQSRPLHRKESFFPALETVPRIYAVTSEHNRGLRDVVVEYTRLQRTKSNNRDSFMFTDKVEELFESVPEFAADVLQSWLKMPYLGYCEEQDCGRILREQNIVCGSCGECGRNKNRIRTRDPSSQSLWTALE